MPTLIGQRREGSARLRSRDGIPVFEETYVFLVKADYATQSRLEIMATSGLPTLHLSTSEGGFAVCVGKDAKRLPEHSLYWEVTCEFSSEVKEGQGNEPTEDPQIWVPIYETKFERLQELVAEDQSGNAIANSAGVPFEVGLTITRHIPVWEFYQFESASIKDETIIERSETVNSGTFKGRAAKTLLCIVLSSVIGYYYGQLRRLTKYQLKYNKSDWTHKRLDIGTSYKSGTTLLDYTSDDDPPSIILGSLNGSGGKQAVGTPPYVLSFDVYATNSFSFLRI